MGIHEEYKALRNYAINNLDYSSSSSIFSSLVGLFQYKPIIYGWRIGVTDERTENVWQWSSAGSNMTYNEWAQVYQWNIPDDNDNALSYGGADCAVAAMKNDLIRIVQSWEDEENVGRWIDDLRNGEDFILVDIPCYGRRFDIFA